MVLTSPLKRARETCELSGLGDAAAIDNDLMEWNYGEYEGLTSREIRQKVPGWLLFDHGCPGGETPEQVGDVLIASSPERVANKETSRSSPTATCCGSLRRAGWDSRRVSGVIFFLILGL